MSFSTHGKEKLAKEKKSHFEMDIHHPCFINKLLTVMNKNNIDVEMLCQDAKMLHKLLTPSVLIEHVTDNTIIEKPILDIKTFIKNNPPQAIIFFGNNDIKQIEHLVLILKYLRSENINTKTIPIFISGKGGHATTTGPTPFFTEAETIARRLCELGINNKIILEKEATNSGENVRFIDALIKKEIEENNKVFNHLVLAGSPVGIVRQTRTFEEQSTTAWKKLSSLPPHWTILQQNYYSKLPDSLINFYAALREAGTFFLYTLKNDFMSARAIDETILKDALQIYLRYFSFLTNKKMIAKDFIDLFCHFAKAKEKAKSLSALINQDTHFKNEQEVLLNFFEPISFYFRTGFDLVEKQWMKHLTENNAPTLQIQSAQLPIPTYSIFNVDPVNANDARLMVRDTEAGLFLENKYSSLFKKSV